MAKKQKLDTVPSQLNIRVAIKRDFGPPVAENIVLEGSLLDDDAAIVKAVVKAAGLARKKFAAQLADEAE